MKSLPIIWQRLVTPEGNTCERCADTHQEVEEAVTLLEEALRPLGIVPKLEVREIDQQAFRLDPSESNRIWIAGKPLEDWLSATVGTSHCCSVCGDSLCRTVEMTGQTFEAIPARLILKAALIAASELIDHP